MDIRGSADSSEMLQQLPYSTQQKGGKGANNYACCSRIMDGDQSTAEGKCPQEIGQIKSAQVIDIGRAERECRSGVGYSPKNAADVGVRSEPNIKHASNDQRKNTE